MSKPREPWWGYVKNVLRAYPDYKRELARLRSSVKITPRYNANGGGSGISNPTEALAMQELPRKEQLRLEAVERALAETWRLPNGRWRCSIIEQVYFRKSHTLQGAADYCHVSYDTALNWHGDFIRKVADELHLL